MDGVDAAGPIGRWVIVSAREAVAAEAASRAAVHEERAGVGLGECQSSSLPPLRAGAPIDVPSEIKVQTSVEAAGGNSALASHDSLHGADELADATGAAPYAADALVPSLALSQRGAAAALVETVAGTVGPASVAWQVAALGGENASLAVNLTTLEPQRRLAVAVAASCLPADLAEGALAFAETIVGARRRGCGSVTAAAVLEEAAATKDGWSAGTASKGDVVAAQRWGGEAGVSLWSMVVALAVNCSWQGMAWGGGPTWFEVPTAPYGAEDVVTDATDSPVAAAEVSNSPETSEAAPIATLGTATASLIEQADAVVPPARGGFVSEAAMQALMSTPPDLVLRCCLPLECEAGHAEAPAVFDPRVTELDEDKNLTVDIRCHSMFLTMHSPYFASLLAKTKRHYDGSDHAVLSMPYCDPRTLISVVMWCYGHSLCASPSTAVSLAAAAQYLQIGSLEGACLRQLLPRLAGPEHSPTLLATVHMHSHGQLREEDWSRWHSAAVAAVRRQARTLLDPSNVAQLPSVVLVELIASSDGLPSSFADEEQLVMAAWGWSRGAAARGGRVRLPRLPAASPSVKDLVEQAAIDTTEDGSVVFVDVDAGDGEVGGGDARARVLMQHLAPLLRWSALPMASVASDKLRAMDALPSDAYLSLLRFLGSGDLSLLPRWMQSPPRRSVEARWMAVPKMHHRRSYAGAAACEGCIVVCGGLSGTDRLGSAECLDPFAGLWVRLPDMRFRRAGAAACALGPFVYAIGGFDGKSRLSSVERLDIRSRRWHVVPPMHERRGVLCAVAHGGMVYALGGYDGTRELATAERFNPRANRWEAVSPMRSARVGAAACSLGKYLYVMGGYDGHQELSSAERYDPDTDTWTSVARMSFRRSYIGAAAVDNRIWVVGGAAGKETLNRVEVYDPYSDAWETAAPMMQKRAGVAACALNGIIFACGGHAGRTLSVVEGLDPLGGASSRDTSPPGVIGSVLVPVQAPEPAGEDISRMDSSALRGAGATSAGTIGEEED
jgi:hypothetical protein